MELRKIQSENIKNLNYHVFQILDTEKKSDYDKYQRSIADLKYNVDILKEFGEFKSSNKMPRKIVRKKTRTITRKKTRLLRVQSLNNENINNSSNSLDKLIKKKYYIQTNKDEKSLKKKKKKDNSINKKFIKNKNVDSNKDNTKTQNEIFITHLLNTENNDNSNNTGVSRYSQYIRNSERYNLNKKSYSLNRNLPPIKNKSSLSNNNRNNTLNNLNEKYSYLNQLINDDNKTLNDKNKENFFSYLQTESSGINSKSKKILKINENIVLNMIKNNKKIINNIRHVKNEIEDANIDFETKFKYYNWKYGIADMNKYFIDLESYKKNEEELINKRKSFYDRLDDVIDDIKRRKKNKKIENIKKQFGIKVINDDDDKNKDIDESEKIFAKNTEVKNSLKELYQRQKIEKIKREKIKEILIKSKERFNNIRLKLDQYRIKEKRLKEI